MKRPRWPGDHSPVETITARIIVAAAVVIPLIIVLVSMDA